MMKDHWRDIQNVWHLLEAPLRPNQEVVDAIVAAVGERLSSVLLLGVTPELASAFEHLTAVDKSPEMIGALWHPHTSTQIVRQANWLHMDDAFGSYSAAVGDCSINVLQSLEEMDTLMRIVNERLVDGGVYASRVFERPDEPITDEDLRTIIAAGAHGNFHAFKWQIAMGLAQEQGAAVRAADILAKFNRLFPDRDTIAKQTGWPLEVINTIDVYEQSGMSLVFPNRQEFDRYISPHFDDVQWSSCGTYDLAERCPIVVARNS